MAIVSILIPGYKPQYLARAIASALTQTFTDIEILVGDDTPEGILAELVQGSTDPRIKYFHHGFQNAALNAHALWEKARGKYVKWLFDDDLLMPASVETLVTALRANPDSLMAFHGRVFIDGNDNLTATPPPLLQMGQTARIDRAFLVQNMIGQLNNFIGEPSNIMLAREREIDASRMFDYRSWKLNFLGDVALYLNVSEQAPLIAVGGYLSAFRQHTGQASNHSSPHFSAGLYEWELMIRGEAAAGHLSTSTLAGAKQRLRQFYTNWARNLPEIARFAANLDELVERAPSELLTSEQYQADLAHARQAVAGRIAARGKGEASRHKFCAICERPVSAWIPHPEAGRINLEFMNQMEVVGSTLENHLCPHCYCNDRDRHLWLYLDRARALTDVSQKRVLHIAPEAAVESRIRALQPQAYIAGDLFPQKPEHRKINVEELDFPDGHFDLIICNYVLEHVDRPNVALAEFSRCLAPGGHLVAQTPYSPILKHTFELTTLASEPFAVRYYGQNDHVRLFGADLADQFRAAGLSGDLYPHTTVLGEIDPDTCGCNGNEPFFLFSKGPAHQFAS